MTNISDLARQLLAKHGTTADAAEALISQAQADAGLYRLLTADALRSAAYAAVRRVVTSDRNTVWKEAAMAPVKRSEVSSLAPVAEWGAAIGRGLLDQYYVRCGKALGDATADEVAETIADLNAKASDMLDKSRWLNLILPKIKPGKTVRQSITENQAHKLQATALGNGLPKAGAA